MGIWQTEYIYQASRLTSQVHLSRDPFTAASALRPNQTMHVDKNRTVDFQHFFDEEMKCCEGLALCSDRA
jgi:hypothetical protein